MEQIFGIIKRDEWPEGEWVSEPDYVEKDLAEGWKSCIIRQYHGGLCGYVAVPKGHALHGLDYSHLGGIDTHCDLTYSGTLRRHSDMWAFGFDCAHCGDLLPGHVKYGIQSGQYRNLEYVAGHVLSLEAQLRAFAFKSPEEEAFARSSFAGYGDEKEAFLAGVKWARGNPNVS